MTREHPSEAQTMLRTTVRGNLSEIYLSLQGEGIWVGTPMVFVRLTGCHRRCRYCDTEYALVAERQARFWLGWRKGAPTMIVPNPVSVEQVKAWVDQTAKGVIRWVAFTGGEPLLQAGFLSALGAALKEQGYKLLLETEGGLPQPLQKVLPYLDAVAADIKLPSTTGEPLDWTAVNDFLALIAQAGIQACIKVVVTKDMDKAEFLSAVQLVAQVFGDTLVPFILQPVTPARLVTETPSVEQLFAWAALAQQFLPDVRIIPQVHKLMQLP